MKSEDERWPSKKDFTLRDWQAPPRTLNLSIVGGEYVVITFSESDAQDFQDEEPWTITRADVDGVISELWAEADYFREKYSDDYLDIINPFDLEDTLRKATTSDFFLNGWDGLSSQVPSKYQISWEKIAISPELRKLVNRGYELYRLFFPKGTERANQLNMLPIGSRINISWPKKKSGGGDAWLPHVPWGLMFQHEPPVEGEPIDPLSFLSLRYRIGYISRREVKETSKRLGDFRTTNQVYCLYWGNREKKMREEVVWQKNRIQDWPGKTIAPNGDSKRQKAEVVSLFQDPHPRPVNILYFFCNCKLINGGGSPILQFGNDAGNTDDIIDQDDIGLRSLADEPIIFANACSTAAAEHPYIANKLEAKFFNRGCRAYIGTETRVPVTLASRFAYLFFDIFYGAENSKPVSAGEAFAQTRIFLWRHFRNIGGIFYSYIGLYDLFLEAADKTRINKSNKIS